MLSKPRGRECRNVGRRAGDVRFGQSAFGRSFCAMKTSNG